MGRPALAGRPCYADHGWVDAAAFLTQFEEQDTPRVPRLGGMARANGVVMVSERYWAFAGTDGSLREGRMPVAPRALRAIPLARGLVRLSGSLSPLFKREGVARARRRFRHDVRAARLALARPHAVSARRRASCDRRARGTASSGDLARHR